MSSATTKAKPPPMTFSQRIRGWIERLLGWAESSVSSAVLLREASRTSRRWQTYAARLGFSGVLIGGLLTVIWAAVEAPWASAGQLSGLGRALFVGMATLQFALALMLAPLTSASALIEETEQGTLDLLVLTRLSSHQIAGGKVLSRILVLLTLVFGAMPVMAVVITLGGVSGTEVVAVTLHTAMAVVVAGAMGALFSLFTRSPLLAMIAAAGYAVSNYIVLPSAYAIATSSPRAATHLSLLGGPAAQGPDALLAVLAQIPVVLLTWHIGTRLFALRVSRAHIRRAFSGEVWETARIGKLLLLTAVLGVAAIPLASVPLWAMRAAKSTFTPGYIALHGALWVVGVLANLLMAWLYLRIGVDVVDAIDRTFGRSRKADRPPVAVWKNPIAWREARPRAWGASAVPIQFTWLLGVLLLSQSTLWVIPGGLVGLGLFNLVAAVVLTLWLATWSVESERRGGSLEVLLTTTLPPWRIVAGKAAGIALPTAPLVLISLPLLVFGNLYFNAVLQVDGNIGLWIVRGIGAWFWAVCLWGLSIGLGMTAALLARKRSAFALCVGSMAFALGVPATAGRLFPDTWWIAGPARLVAPPLAGEPAIWQLFLSTLGVGALALGLAALVTVNLRRWAVGMAALLSVGLGLAAGPAQAQGLVEIDPELQMVARPLNGGVSREDQWTALQVSVLNTGAPTTATLELVERPPGAQDMLPYRRTLELSEKARKDVLLLVRPGIATRARQVTLNGGPTRQIQADITWQHVSADGVVLGVIGDDALGTTALGQTWIGPVPGRQPQANASETRPVRAGLLDPRLLPRHSAAYDALDQVVWHRADPTTLGARELDALLGWVASGGHLVITVSDTWRQVADSPLGEALPVDLIGTRDAPSLEPLYAAMNLRGVPDGPTPQALAVPRAHPDRGAWVVVADPGGYALWSIGTYGLGSITVLAVDPETEPLASTDRLDLWRSLLWLPLPGTGIRAWRADLDRARPEHEGEAPPPSLLAALRLWEPGGYECFWNNGWQDFGGYDMNAPRTGWEEHVKDRLEDIPGASPLPLSWLIGFSVLYLLAVGPLDYFVLRALKKEPWTWVTFPVTVLVFSGVALVGTAMTKGSQAVVTRVEVVDVLPGTDRWRGQTSLGVFSTRKTRLRLASGPSDGVMRPLGDGGFMGEPEVITEEGPGAIGYRAETWSMTYAFSSWVEAGHGRMRILQEASGPVLVNSLGVDLEEVMLIEGDPTGRSIQLRTLDLGPMAVGERVPIGPDARWGTTQPSGELRWAWRVLREHPEAVGAHLHSGSWPYTVVALSSEPVEEVALTGLAPIEKNYTVFRVPLGSPVAPGRPAWSDELP